MCACAAVKSLVKQVSLPSCAEQDFEKALAEPVKALEMKRKK